LCDILRLESDPSGKGILYKLGYDIAYDIAYDIHYDTMVDHFVRDIS